MSTIDCTRAACAICGGTEFYRNGRCAPCSRAYAAAYRQKHPESTKAATAKWVARNKPRIAESMRQWRSENAENIRAYEIEYRARNHERVRAREKKYRAKFAHKVKQWAANFRARNKAKIAEADAKYYKKNAAAIRAKVLKWQKENPDLCRVRMQNRRARKVGAGQLSKDIAARLFVLQRGRCPCCQRPLGRGFHLDHIVPLAKGGLNVDENIQLLRRECNHHKSAKMPIEFMQSRGFLL